MGPFDRSISSNDLPVTYKKRVVIHSPISGKVVPLNDVPSPVFSHRLFGEGIAIEPSGFQLLAPLDAQIQHLPGTAHQVRLRCKNGLHMLIQVGIDSEQMMAEGFKVKFKPGDVVKQGECILEFNLRLMRQRLSSLLCPVTIMNSDKIKGVQAHCNKVMAAEDPVMTLYI